MDICTASAIVPILNHVVIVHCPNYQRRIEDLQQFGGIRPLGKLVEIKSGLHTIQRMNDLISGQDTCAPDQK